MTPCYNDEENIRNIYTKIKQIFDNLGRYRYEHIFIDNAYKEKAVTILKEIASYDKNVKIIVNAKNFGVYCSPLPGIFQTKGDAVIGVIADLQDPPELIPEFLRKWEDGYKIAGVLLIFLGIIGEYIGAIFNRLFQRWLVIEKERINFD